MSATETVAEPSQTRIFTDLERLRWLWRAARDDFDGAKTSLDTLSHELGTGDWNQVGDLGNGAGVAEATGLELRVRDLLAKLGEIGEVIGEAEERGP